MSWLQQRERLPEQMDEPGLDPVAHAQALRGLARINAWSRSDAILWPEIAQSACRVGRTIRVLDVASGAGDVLLRLERRARSAGLTIEWIGVDGSTVAVEHASQQARAANSAVRFQVGDALSGPLPEADIACSSLFLHHLDKAPALTLLRRLIEAAPQALVNDLRRCWTGYLAAVIGTRLLSRSPVVHYDGPVSVRGAFTPAEALALAKEAEWVDAKAVHRWPFRFLLSGRRA